MLKYCALVPARNEAIRIASTIEALCSRPELETVIVIDDASTDDTARIARESSATQVVTLSSRLGKGGALMAGLAAAPADAQAFLFLDADLGDSATEFVKLIGPIETDDADMTIGLLPPDPGLVAEGKKGGGIGLAVRFARNGLLRKTGQEFQQPLAGQRAIRREVLALTDYKLPTGFGVEVGLTLSAFTNGYRIIEVPTMFRHRVTGHDFHANLHRARQLLDIASALRSRRQNCQTAR